MEIIKTADFKKIFKKLPKEIQRLYISQEIKFKRNWRDSRLHIKKIKSLAQCFTFRITRRYRVFFYFQEEEKAIFFEIDHRKDIYR
ncbi:hypothetical protein A2Y83_02355 [Candidatus Falkowbacteria bacterium RBG_13_39_14]|uniref:Plasmid stabilization protein n=1 Tax=Candidatus Falkowbacteria bacterium RBG_13_39_14 TaxID=1797985 RepID=A0A1F5S5T7_9BACT|nr:MAG: hypothetical protein A2Y83_02355 [Candidatus Falkowbacteria bacterium RBG_13_39_14]